MRIGGRAPMRSPNGGVALYYGILAFSLVIAWWIREPMLFGLGVLLHVSLLLVVWAWYAVNGNRAARRAFASGSQSAFE